MPMAATTAAADAGLRLRAVRRGAMTVVTELDGSEPWLPRVLGAHGEPARVALIQSRATLLGGDVVTVAIEVAPGAALELVELGSTIAHDARAGASARVDVTVVLGADARLVWRAPPLIAAAGCRVFRSTSVALDPGARVLLQDALVLGRAGEAAGRVRSRTRVTLAGRPVLDETLDTEPAWLLASSAVAGDAGMVGGLMLAGVRDPDAPPGALQLHEPGTLWRTLGRALSELDATASTLARRWRALVLG